MDGGIFSGLEDMGLGNLQNVDIFKDNTKHPESEQEKLKEAETLQIHEEDMLFDKTYDCPVCNHKFKARTLRTGKARLLSTDMDLRPKFEGIEPLKYDVVLCPKCGFTALTRYFVPMPAVQRKMILEKITANFRPQMESGETFTYEEAINRYKLALANAVVKMGHASEKAYICLRAGWLVRSYIEELLGEEQIDMQKVKHAEELQNEFLKKAYEGFVNARQSEGFPMCGMDEPTVDYVLANLAMRFGHYDVASKMISSMMVSPSCNNRMKDRFRDLKDELVKQMKDSQNK